MSKYVNDMLRRPFLSSLDVSFICWGFLLLIVLVLARRHLRLLFEINSVEAWNLSRSSVAFFEISIYIVLATIVNTQSKTQILQIPSPIFQI